MKKGIRNIDAVACKLGLALIRVTNQKLEVVREERWKRGKIVEKRTIKAIAAKFGRARGRISLSSEEKKN